MTKKTKEVPRRVEKFQQKQSLFGKAIGSSFLILKNSINRILNFFGEFTIGFSNLIRLLLVSKIALVLMLLVFVIPLTAFEAHVVNVTATIERRQNECPALSIGYWRNHEGCTTRDSNPLCGDINADGLINASDTTMYQDYIFSGGTTPPGVKTDLNGDGQPDVFDLNVLNDYLYADGPAPTCGGNNNSNGHGSSVWETQVQVLSATYSGVFAPLSGSQMCNNLWIPDCPSGNTYEAKLCRAKAQTLADELNVVSDRLDLNAIIAGADDGSAAFDNLGLNSNSTVSQALAALEMVIANSSSTAGQLTEVAHVAERIYSFYENENPEAPMCLYGWGGMQANSFSVSSDPELNSLGASILNTVSPEDDISVQEEGGTSGEAAPDQTENSSEEPPADQGAPDGQTPGEASTSTESSTPQDTVSSTDPSGNQAPSPNPEPEPQPQPEPTSQQEPPTPSADPVSSPDPAPTPTE